MIDRIIDDAAAVIEKWNPDCSTYAKLTSLFLESKIESKQFLKCVHDLRKAMDYLIIQDYTSEKLVYAQKLMEIAMKRLQKEFYQILSMNRAHLYPESVSARSSLTSGTPSISDEDYNNSPEDDSVRIAGEAISDVEQVSSAAMADLKSIAEGMISSGYAKECANIYKMVRKSIIDEAIYRLGVERWSSSQINKMDWKFLELKIKNWLEATKIATKTLLFRERILCDQVFAISDSIRESCFSEISKEGATLLFVFPELIAKRKNSPEKLFSVLEMYTAVSENWPEIEAIFSFDSTASVRSQALKSLTKLRESAPPLLADFESTIQKDSSKSPVPGGAVHPLTFYAMDYLSHLANHHNLLTNIFTDMPSPETSSLPEFYFDTPDSNESPSPEISIRIAWLILVLLCKLDSKANHYKDVSLSYLFLANNVQHVVTKVRSSNLRDILGEEYIAKHEGEARQFALKYERLGWDPIIESLPENPTAMISSEEAKDCFNRFNSRFQEAYRKYGSCVVTDSKLRDEIKVSIARKLITVYREFYDTHRLTVACERNVGLIVKFAPEDLGNYLSDLFFEENLSASAAASSSSSKHWSHCRHFWHC